jgi:DNA-directed RNA polymerase specialized sigma24 family protein
MGPGRRQRIQSWVLRFADGDREAFQPLFDDLWPVLVAFTSRGLGDRAAAEDAAQQAIIKVFSRIADFDRGRDGVSWALGIAGFEVMTIRKQRLRRREVGPAPLGAVVDGRTNAEEQAIMEELHGAVVAVAGELSERDRAALAYAFTGEEPPADERSRKQRFRALDRLRAAWKKTQRKVHG